MTEEWFPFLRLLLIFMGIVPLLGGRLVMLPMGSEYPEFVGDFTALGCEGEAPVPAAMEQSELNHSLQFLVEQDKLLLWVDGTECDL